MFIFYATVLLSQYHSIYHSRRTAIRLVIFILAIKKIKKGRKNQFSVTRYNLINDTGNHTNLFATYSSYSRALFSTPTDHLESNDFINAVHFHRAVGS